MLHAFRGLFILKMFYDYELVLISSMHVTKLCSHVFRHGFVKGYCYNMGQQPNYNQSLTFQVILTERRVKE